MGLLRQIHDVLRARFVRHYQIREVTKVFELAHAQELRFAPPNTWPMLDARHKQELAAIRAGKLNINVASKDIVDRTSWEWPYLPASVTRMATPIAKITPYNIRRFSRTPVPRRAINMIKGSVIAQPWDIRPLEDVDPPNGEDDQKARIKISRTILRHPNNVDSFQTWVEKSIEDICVLGAFSTELRYTPDPERPLKMWAIAVESIRLFPAWTESTPDMPHYAQMTGLKGERGALVFADDEILYVRDNPSTDNPFGLGKVEVAFQQINDLLGVQYMAGRAGTDQVHKTWLWWEQPQTEGAYQIVRRHIQNELEGQAKVSIIGGMKKPEIIEIQPTLEDDLLLNWQEMLIRMIANAFDMSAMALGIEHDVNRAVGEVLDDRDFRSAVVPMAKRIAEAITRKILHEKLHWYDLEFAFLNLDDPDLQTMTDMLARMYSGNAVTPNQWREKVRMQKLSSPLADLTQIEAMMLLTEATAKVQERSAEKAQERQAALMPPPPPMLPGPTGSPAANKPGLPGVPAPSKVPATTAPGGAPGGSKRNALGQPPNPPKMKLPKFPISGSRWSARDVANMPVNKLSELISNGQLPPPKKLLRDMKHQEPNIIEEMTEEVREFFEQMLKDEEQQKKEQAPKPADIALRTKEQRDRFREELRKSHDFADYLMKRGTQMGKPGGGPLWNPNAKPLVDRKAGTPGNINPLRRI